MSDARNEYPRHCRVCWAVIPDFEHDHANYNYGGICEDCAKLDGAGELELHDQFTMFNTVYDRDAEDLPGQYGWTSWAIGEIHRLRALVKE